MFFICDLRTPNKKGRKVGYAYIDYLNVNHVIISKQENEKNKRIVGAVH